MPIIDKQLNKFCLKLSHLAHWIRAVFEDGVSTSVDEADPGGAGVLGFSDNEG